MNNKIFENKLGYRFKSNHLLIQALTHPSMHTNNKDDSFDYERLEFLGDAVLALVITIFLIEAYPKEKEGDLAQRRSALVCGKTLAEIAKSLDLGKYIIMSYGEEHTGGRLNNNNLENVMEALIGAIFIDGGLEAARKIINLFWQPKIKAMKDIPFNPKTKLQEISQAQKKGIPKYELISVEGEAHQPSFEIKVSLAKKLCATAKGNSKKVAENLAAVKLLKIMENVNNDSRT